MSEYKDNDEINKAVGVGEEPIMEEPKIGVTKVEVPRADAIPPIKMPKLDIPKMEAPNVELGVTAQSKVEEPNIELDVTSQPKMEEPNIESDVTSQPKMEEPNIESDVIPQPKVEEPKVEPYVAPRPKVYDTYQFSQAKPVAKSAPKESKKKNGLGRKFAVCIVLALVFGLISGAVFLGVNALGQHYIGSTAGDNFVKLPETVDQSIEETGKVAESVQPEDINPETMSTGNVAEVAANVMPSVVAISNVSVQEVPDFFGSQQFESESSGSGIIVGQNDTELLVATNNHVVAGAKTITVTFIDMSSVEAQIKGTDADNDLAVVAVSIADIQDTTLEAIKVATIGDSNKLVVGEQVVAIGNALGYGQSVTAGYVSALDREVTVENVAANLIQTDAAINPGNSGGALLNMKGELIGINAVKFAANGVEGMGYAIPVSTANPILGELMNRVTRSKVDVAKASYLGVTCRAITEETAAMYNMPMGVFVAEVASGSAAEKAGIKMGDIITKFDDITIKTYNELVDALQYYEAGETVEMVIARAEAGEYQDQKVSVTLDTRPADLDSQKRQERNPEDNRQNSGQSGEFSFPW